MKEYERVRFRLGKAYKNITRAAKYLHESMEPMVLDSLMHDNDGNKSGEYCKEIDREYGEAIKCAIHVHRLMEEAETRLKDE